jgi:hypothetical protein
MREGFRPRALFFGIALAAQVVAALAGQAALAQAPKKATAAKSHPGPRPSPKRPSSGFPPVAPAAPAPRARDSSQLESPSATSASAGAAAAAPAGTGMASDAGVVDARTLDGGAHVFKFSELDIEGRLKSPQLVYFLRRVRAEFAAGDLGHRSFLREMSETRKEPSF